MLAELGADKIKPHVKRFEVLTVPLPRFAGAALLSLLLEWGGERGPRAGLLGPALSSSEAA